MINLIQTILQSIGSNASTTGSNGNVVDDVSELHKSVFAPSSVRFESEAAKAGDQWTKTFWVETWPKEPADGFLRHLFSQPGIETDVSIHVEPRDSEQAEDELEERISSLTAKYEDKQERGDIGWRSVKRTRDDLQEMFDTLQDTETEVVDASMYVTVRADDRDQLDTVARATKRLLKKSPANTRPVTASHRQDKGLLSTSPIGKDDLGKQSAMMGGAVGAMFPFSSGTLIEETGTEYGVHAYNYSPVIANLFDRDTGYNMLIIGNIGSGKSVSVGLQIVRRRMYDEDTVVIILDPLRGYVGVTEALGGKRIVVGGQVGLNPLEIKPTPEEVLAEAGHDLDPYAAKLKDVMGFFETYFEMRDNPLGDRRGVLEGAIKAAYEQQGITRDPETHGKESPTIPDVMEILAAMTDDPGTFAVSESSEERQKIKEKASELLIGFEPFTEGGEFENLAQPTDEKVDFSGANMVYLDLQQQEARGGTGLMMQLLFNSVYQRAKQTDKQVIFAIDEARYIMKDAANLAFLEQAVRHSRHYDLSIQFITQTVDEFFQRPEAEAIADNCSLKLLHKIEGMDEELADELDLTRQQMNFVKDATAGNEGTGYSEALFGVADEGWFPIQVRANPLELDVVDFDPDDDDRSDLPGIDE